MQEVYTVQCRHVLISYGGCFASASAIKGCWCMLSEQIVSSPVCRSAFEGVGPHAGSTLTLWFSGRSQRGPSRIRTRTRTRSKPWACSRMRPSSARTRPQVRLALCTLHFLVSPLGLHKAQHTSQTHLASLGCKRVFVHSKRSIAGHLPCRVWTRLQL